ncbi:hypothetical protein ACT3SZ_09850 [Corynebacterium sp. AOP40-9SA-29]|uniref:hypothetical protein n=1 Tax=Corynebacterium sp. AOP40-9SA-29 TaxID=3457677 RepID=UPI004033ABC5
MTDSENDRQTLYFVYSDKEGFGGFCIAAFSDPALLHLKAFNSSTDLAFHMRQEVTIIPVSPTTADPGDSADHVWVLLQGWSDFISQWEDFHPTLVAASRGKKVLEKLQRETYTGSNTVIMRIPDGWRYGFDDIPEDFSPPS